MVEEQEGEGRRREGKHFIIVSICIVRTGAGWVKDGMLQCHNVGMCTYIRI